MQGEVGGGGGVDIRSVIGFREVGCGYAAMKSFSRCMNINCLSENGFNSVNNDVINVYRKAAALSMKESYGENVCRICYGTFTCFLFFIYGLFSSGKRVKSHDSAEKLSRSHGKPENYKKQQK